MGLHVYKLIMENFKIILSTIVGSRLHGTATPESDYDYRGVFIVPIVDIISPFKEPKDTHWLEGEEDNTAYELTKFCKMCAQGNSSALEVLVGLPHETTETGERLKKLLPCFLSKSRCFNAFMGYSKNQEKKFRDPTISNAKGKDVIGKNRKYKYACAHVRTLYQLLHLLTTCELSGTYSEGVTQELIQIKNGFWRDADIMNRIFQLEQKCDDAYKVTNLPEKPDIDKIEQFILDTYKLE
jgi:predicted nucleotidyltransferase